MRWPCEFRGARASGLERFFPRPQNPALFIKRPSKTTAQPNYPTGTFPASASAPLRWVHSALLAPGGSAPFAFHQLARFTPIERGRR